MGAGLPRRTGTVDNLIAQGHCVVVEYTEKVRAQRTYFDTGSMLAQLGITTATPAHSK